MTKTILIDMDEVLADFNGKKHELMLEKGFTDYPKAEERKYYSDENDPDLTKGEKEEAGKIQRSRGFFEELQPIEGSIEAVKEMMDLGLDVRFCTSPYITNPSCFQAKADWIEKYFGLDGVFRLVMTTDKTLVKGDFLIDDNPAIAEGKRYKPEWKHLVFRQNYNKDLFPERDYIDWKNWKEVLRNHGVEI